MTTQADITNRALQLIGTRTTVTDGEIAGNSTNEAVQSNQCYTALRDWCFGIVNWNFARKTNLLTVSKTATLPTWSTASPAPPWTHQFLLPSDFIKAQYLTNGDANAHYFLGEPQRFAIAMDTISSIQQKVLLTNQSVGILVYTARITDPTLWPWYFERIVVGAMASSMSYALEGDKEHLKMLDEHWQRYVQAGAQANQSEGLAILDATPEWIQALGLSYPSRRPDPRVPPPAPQRPNDNRS